MPPPPSSPQKAPQIKQCKRNSQKDYWLIRPLLLSMFVLVHKIYTAKITSTLRMLHWILGIGVLLCFAASYPYPLVKIGGCRDLRTSLKDKVTIKKNIHVVLNPRKVLKAQYLRSPIGHFNHNTFLNFQKRLQRSSHYKLRIALAN